MYIVFVTRTINFIFNFTFIVCQVYKALNNEKLVSRMVMCDK